ncbi:hypothetical protein K1719_008061 [Acacia pycnantha]|nr:hypothetical protein K1719_008061 [Acacia pycnantha]
MSEMLKRRKMCIWESDPPNPAISNYADKLKRTKKRVRRSGKRKVRGDKENTSEEEVLMDEAMVDLVLPDSVGDTFVFKVKRGRRTKTASEGSDHHALIIDCCFSEVKAPRKVIELLRKDLSLCYAGNFNAEKLVEAETLVKKIEEAWGKEEMYWWQRSKISWLTCGDRNTKFFHSSVIQRRQRNKVLRLKDETGVWMEDRKVINKTFSNFYMTLFSSVGSRPLDQALSYVRKVVSPQDNADLTRPVSDLEIENAVFQLGANKAPGPDGFSALFYQSTWKSINKEGNRRSAGFTDEERKSFTENFLSKGFVDTFRRQHPGVVGYTYWGYRHGGRKTNRGWRLDYFLVSESIADKVYDSYILPDVAGSDHCPVGLTVRL